MQKISRNEVHILDFPAGHRLNSDCWCEPTKIWWAHYQGKDILVVEHKDEIPKHHREELRDRNKEPDWITTALNAAYMRGFTKLL